ncbi:36.4 kDa proline-rich protein-like [Cryptomeria japonica]|uniref:36.4 kDa proline-rich protein-like n=1 Tax=Cryptomeria japonica TaxID=3369 RepID=UPI0025ACDAAE|nr:36.4 kDa proline-rich protein-like [Cryptomeria japonica]
MTKGAIMVVMGIICLVLSMGPVVEAWHSPPPPSSPSSPSPPPPPGLCVDLLDGLVNVTIGDPVVNKCCPVLEGVLALEAALCLCTIIRVKLLNLNIILPIALELFVQCGLTPPSGFTCPPLT